MTARIKQAVDGFSYNTSFGWYPCRYFPNALAQLDVLRRAANYRARWWTVPNDIGTTIVGYDTLQEQINVAPGSYLWGYNFVSLTALTPAGAPTTTAATDLLVEATDACTGIPIFQDFANAGGMSANFNSRMLPILLTQPRLILEPGLINVEIANRTANTITCQLLLLFAESCKLITEESREWDWKRGQNA